MQWLVAVMRYAGDTGSLLIQTEDERIYTLTTHSMTPADIGKLISDTFNIPANRVVYHDTRQTLYRRLTYMRFVVCE
jgi:hypothetical protein